MEFALPQMGEGVYEVELVGWLVKPGESVRRGQGLMEVLTDKATMEVPAPFAGRVTATLAEVGARLAIGQTILTYDGGAEPSTESPKAAPAEVAGVADRPAEDLPAHLRGPHHSPPASPAVRKLARKMGVDLTLLKGAGPGGRILLDDLADFLRARSPADVPATPVAAPKPDFGKPGTRIKMQGVRRRIAEHMVHASRTIPHYSYIDECDLTEVVKLRQQLREPFARQGVKLTYLAFVVKAAALALKEVPIVNASLQEEDGEIVLHDRYDVGVAVATPTGLVVPIVRSADEKSVAQIAHEIDRLSADARAGRSRRDDLRGGTFTVTSVGGIGGLISTPIVNHPEVGILGLGKVVKRPVYDAEGQIVPAQLMYLSFSFDHRVVDGAVGAAFGNAVIRHLSSPALLLLPERLV